MADRAESYWHLLDDPAALHFHVYDTEELIDARIEARNARPQPAHLCRRHFTAFEHLQGHYRLASCGGDDYFVEPATGCHEPCPHCAREGVTLG